METLQNSSTVSSYICCDIARFTSHSIGSEMATPLFWLGRFHPKTCGGWGECVGHLRRLSNLYHGLGLLPISRLQPLNPQMQSHISQERSPVPVQNPSGRVQIALRAKSDSCTSERSKYRPPNQTLYFLQRRHESIVAADPLLTTAPNFARTLAWTQKLIAHSMLWKIAPMFLQSSGSSHLVV
jgi:hypothetical protein